MALKAYLETPAIHLEGRRQSRRALRLETSGHLPGGAQANVTVHNISIAGLLLETDLALGIGEVLAIELPDAGPVGAEIVWQSERLFGCAFQQALGEAELAATQLRGGRTADYFQPVRTFQMGDVDRLGPRLNRLRREQHLTLAQVAARLGVSKPTVWAWEKGKARPLPERIDAIAEVLGVNAETLTQSSQGADGVAVVEECRLRIAAAYSAEPKAVRIMLDL